VKALLGITGASALLTLLAIARLLYVSSQSLHTKDAILGEALDPLNMVAVLGLYGFGALTILLLFVCLIGGIFFLYSNAPSKSKEEIRQ